MKAKRTAIPFVAITTVSILVTGLWSCTNIYEHPEISELTPVKFHIEGNRIVDAGGDEMTFRGICPPDVLYFRFDWFQDIHPVYDRSYFQEIANWGANIVRLGIHPYSWRKFGSEVSLAHIEEAVLWAQECGMYSYIDFHSIGFVPDGKYEAMNDDIYDTTKEEMLEFWDLVSAYFHDNDAVAFYEIFNEPVNLDEPRDQAVMAADWDAWKVLVEEVVDIIRANDPDSIVIVGGMTWAYDLSPVLSNPVERDNIVYATHPYPDMNYDRSWDTAFGQVAEVYPVFATEFGFTIVGQKAEHRYTGSGKYRTEIIDYLEDRQMSWTVWCFSPDWGPRLILNKDYYPTAAGKYFRQRLLELNHGVIAD